MRSTAGWASCGADVERARRGEYGPARTAFVYVRELDGAAGEVRVQPSAFRKTEAVRGFAQ